MANRRKGRAARPRKKREKLAAPRDDDSLAGSDAASTGSCLGEEEGEEEGLAAGTVGDDEEGGGAVAVVGTYDGGLLGFRVADGAQTFGFAPHVGCVKAVHCSASGRLASGGTDHNIRLFDIGRGVELGDIQEHADTVSCLQFWGATTLVSGGDDGKVCVWRTSDWELLHKFHAHKGGALTCLAIHPSGRLMASAGRDRSLRLWDLTRGTAAANLVEEEPVECLQWSPGAGDSVAALCGSSVRVVNARSGASALFEAGKRAGLSACLFLSAAEVVVGDGKGELVVLALGKGGAELAVACRLPPAEGGRSRVKALARGGAAADPACHLFAAGLSSGVVDIWAVAAASGGDRQGDFSRLRQVDTKARLTCLHLWPGRAAAAGGPQAAQPLPGAGARAGRGRKRRRGAATAAAA